MSIVSRGRIVRIAVVVGIAVLAYAAADAAGLLDYLEPAELAERIRQSGPAGIAVFITAFCIGELTQVPGTVFFTAAVGVWGLQVGTVLSVTGAIIACTFAFATVRMTGRWVLEGRSLEALRRHAPYIERAPLRTTIVLRLVLGASPPVNWALALSAIGWRDFLAGTTVGITPNVAVYVWLLDQLAFASEPVLPAWAVIVLLLTLVSVGALTLRSARRREHG